jgi:hypothetical protein
MMRHGIDHLLTFVADPEAAVSVMGRLGFTLTPASHIAEMGLVNRMILFADADPDAANFIEMMSVTEATRLPPPMAPLLTPPDGIKSMVLTSAHVPASAAHFRALGHEFAAPAHVKREWRVDEDTSVHPEFDVLMPVTADLTFNACKYVDPSLYKRRDWTAHANGATGLSGVIALTRSITTTANTFAAVLGCAAEPIAGGVTLRSGRVALELIDPDGFTRRYDRPPPQHAGDAAYIGYRLRAHNPAHFATIAARVGHAAVATPEGLRLTETVLGNLIEVEPADTINRIGP